MKLSCKFLGLFLLASTVSLANDPSDSPDAKILTFSDALTSAYDLNYITPAKYDVQGAFEDLSSAKREWLPQTSFETSYTADFDHIRRKSDTNLQLPRGDVGKSGSYNTQAHEGKNVLKLSQNIFAGGKTVASIRGQKRNVEKATAEYYKKEGAVLTHAIKVYSMLMRRRATYKVHLANEKVLLEQVRSAKSAYQLGASKISDLAQTEAKLAKVQAQVTKSKAELEGTKAMFEQFIGLPPVFKLEPAPIPHTLPKSEKEAVDWAMQYSYDLKSADADADISKENVTVSRSALLPSLDVAAAGSRNFNSNWNRHFEKRATSNFEAKATLTIPLDFRGSSQAGMRKQKYTAAKKRLDAMNLRRDISAKVAAKWSETMARQQNIAKFEEEVRTAKIAYEGMQAEFAAGTKTTFELLATEQEYFNARISLVDAQQEFLETAYELVNEMGLLNADYLKLSVKRFETKDYHVPVWGTNIKK